LRAPLYLTLSHHPNGVSIASGNAVGFAVDGGEAHFGPTTIAGRALRWILHRGETEKATSTLLSAEVELDPAVSWLMRCDQIDFDPGGIARRHTHPGPGIRCLLSGSIRIETGGMNHAYSPFEAWFESGPDPVLAHSSPDIGTSFVRVMLLPDDWAGRRTIRYVDPADHDRPKTQSATVHGEWPVSRDLDQAG
jgi:hypothetical protein